jgi:hypothetical protein
VNSTLLRRARATAGAAVAMVAVTVAGAAAPPAHAQVGGGIVPFDIVARDLGFSATPGKTYFMSADNIGNTGIVTAIKCTDYFQPAGQDLPTVTKYTINVNWEFPANSWAVWEFNKVPRILPSGQGNFDTLECRFTGKMLNGDAERDTSNNSRPFSYY